MYLNITDYYDLKQKPKAEIVSSKTEITTDTFFDELKNYNIHLNLPQQEAVLTVNGPVLIVAGAGSGKTTTLTSRISYMITKKQIDPRRILLVTFTKKASTEMKERLNNLPNGRLCSSINVGTYHAICLQILREEGRKFEVLSSDYRRHIMFKTILKKLKASDDYTPEGVMHVISSWKNQLIRPVDVKEIMKNPDLSTSEKEMYELLYQAYRLYEEQKEKANLYDFDDFLLETYYLFKYDEAALKRYQNRYEYVLCDEFQDVSFIQYEITRMLAAPHNNLCVVGDDGQTIYSWRTASSKYMIEFNQQYQNCKRIILDINYRSTADIVGFGNNIIRHNTKQIKKQLKSTKQERKDIQFKIAKTPEEEAELVVKEISRLMVQGKRYKDIAILYRTHTYSRSIFEELVLADIPFIHHVKSTESFYDSPNVKLFLAAMRLALNPFDFDAIVEVGPLLYVSKKEIQETLPIAIAMQTTSDQSLFEIVMSLIANRKGEFQKGQILMKVSEILSFKTMAPKDIIHRIRKGTINYEKQLEVDAAKTMTIHKDMILETLDEFLVSASRFKTIKELLDFIEKLKAKQEEMERLRLDPNLDALDLMSIHTSKGLEYEVVFAIGWFEDMIPHITAIEGSKNSLADSNLKGEEALFEERRIAYVCATRAKKLLYLSVPKLYHSKEKSPSRFILEGLKGEEIKEIEKVETEKAEISNQIFKGLQKVMKAYFKTN
ncbi:ATP-dependent helicase [Lysinibacillus antri]|uniref:DNA 3'-5' helicase n=1 Tax=Lysinibacillus antri TaxID=2498145 RepID=A0A432L871_9BACI|nr:ATP-dependent helicase [Lysinibacillus antri]RUL48801.1 ATP-dependent helicase [Lysinibacillus antri]